MKRNDLILALVVILATIFIAFAVGKGGEQIGFAVLGFAIGLPFFVLILYKFKYGFYLLLVYTSFMPLMAKALGGNIPWGVVAEAILYLSVFSFFVKASFKRDVDFSFLKDPLIYLFTGLLIYSCLLIFNPSSTSMAGSLFGLRFIVYRAAIFFLGLFVFTSVKEIKKGVLVWLAIASFAALYAMKQEFVGLFPFERAYLDDPERYNLIVIFGKIRKWSIFAGPTDFGLLMSISAIGLTVYGIVSKKSFLEKLKVVPLVVIMVITILWSGTRTAYAIVPIGLSVFFLMRLNKLSTILTSAVGIFILGLILFGPFYGNPTINRIRSTLKGDEDPSMNVRTVNRHRIQPYIYSHPIGGGLSTVEDAGVRFSPSHHLAGFPPDNGYLKIALEKGWIGLVLHMLFYTLIMIRGINLFYDAKNYQIKIFCAIFTPVLLAIFVANYTQLAIIQRPMDFIVMAIFSAIFKMKYLKSKEQLNEKD